MVDKNFRGLQLQVASKLNSSKFAEYLTDYWDWQLPMFIKFGFPLDVKNENEITSDQINHKSALQHPKHVEAYLKEEKE